MRNAVRAGLALLLTFGLSVAAMAAPFTVTAQLTGDPRLSNPDNIVIDVTITGDTLTNVVNWIVAPASPFHPNLTLDAFGFNVALPTGTTAAFGDFAPSDWGTPSVDATLVGSGATKFQFVFSDPPKPTNNVTNLIPLTFSMTLSQGLFSPEIFLNAPFSVSNDGVLGSGQLGAHVRSLNAVEDESDSGVAFGNYTWKRVCVEGCNGGDTGNGGDTVPEPASAVLLGVGLLGAASVVARRRRS